MTFRPSRHHAPVLVPEWPDAEEFAAWHMRKLGFEDATHTGSGADQGLDVRSRRAVAQVKHHKTKVGSPDIQRLLGSALRTQLPIFYSLSGYSPAALESAADIVALFMYDIYGNVRALNRVAEDLVFAASGGKDGGTNLLVSLRDVCAPHDKQCINKLIEDRWEEIWDIEQAVLDEANSVYVLNYYHSGVDRADPVAFTIPEALAGRMSQFYNLLLADIEQMNKDFSRIKREHRKLQSYAPPHYVWKESVYALKLYYDLLGVGQLPLATPLLARVRLFHAYGIWASLKSDFTMKLYSKDGVAEPRVDLYGDNFQVPLHSNRAYRRFVKKTAPSTRKPVSDRQKLSAQGQISTSRSVREHLNILRGMLDAQHKNLAG